VKNIKRIKSEEPNDSKDLSITPNQEDYDVATAIAENLRPDEIKLVVAWTYSKDLDEALGVLNLPMAAYMSWPEKRRQMVESAVAHVMTDAVAMARAVMNQATLQAAMAMIELMDAPDANVRFRAAKFIMENATGKAPQRKDKSFGGAVPVKTYAISDASPQAWDEKDDSEINDIIEAEFDGEDDTNG